MVSGIRHVGIVVDDLDTAVGEWCERYGLRVVETLTTEVEGVRSAFLSSGMSRDNGACVELIEPLDKSDMNNSVARRLAEAGEGFLQLAFAVDDPAAAAARLRAAGAKVFDAPPIAEGEGPRAIVHPKSANGVLVELM